MTTVDAPLHWSAESLREELVPLLPGLSVEVVEECPSTNTALLDRARVPAQPADEGEVQVRRSVESRAFRRPAPDPSPCLLVAQNQTHGRGRLGRSWKAAPGSSLTFSLSLPMAPPSWAGLSLAVGVALAEALQPETRPAVTSIGLKWPNDLWLVDSSGVGRKLGGILIETLAIGSGRVAVIGVGLNVMARPAAAKDGEAEFSSGYACLNELDPQLTAPRALSLVAQPLARALREFEAGGFAPFASRFERLDLLQERQVFTTQPDTPDGVAMGVSPQGALRVRGTDGVVREVSSGEVSVRLAPWTGGAAC